MLRHFDSLDSRLSRNRFSTGAWGRPRVNTRLTGRVIAAQPAGNEPLAGSVSVLDHGAARHRPPGTDEGDSDDRNRALRYLNQEMLGAHEAMVRSSRFPQAEPAPAGHAHPASSDKVLTGV